MSNHNWPTRPEREQNPHAIGNKWLKKHFIEKDALVKAIMAAMYNTGLPIPVLNYYDSTGMIQQEIQYKYDITGDLVFDRCLILAKDFVKEYKAKGITDSLQVYVYLHTLYYLDEDACKSEIISLIKQRMFYATKVASWIYELKRKLEDDD